MWPESPVESVMAKARTSIIATACTVRVGRILHCAHQIVSQNTGRRHGTPARYDRQDLPANSAGSGAGKKTVLAAAV